MGKYPRRKQLRIGEKFRKIRDAFGLSQAEMVRYLGLEDDFTRTNISNYEKNDREPPLFVLLAYAHAAGICLDVLVDDELDLPKRLPNKPSHRPVKVRITRGKKSK